MGQDPSEIREEIEDTRARMGETADALGYKSDVKARAKEKVSGTAQGARRMAGAAQENPLGLALGSVAVGILAGMLVPSTRVEDEKLGDVSDQVKEKVKVTAQEAGERGRQVAQEAAESAKESGQRHAEELKQTAQEKAEETKETAGT
jgi:hypothetical protein